MFFFFFFFIETSLKKTSNFVPVLNSDQRKNEKFV